MTRFAEDKLKARNELFNRMRVDFVTTGIFMAILAFAVIIGLFGYTIGHYNANMESMETRMAQMHDQMEVMEVYLNQCKARDEVN